MNREAYLKKVSKVAAEVEKELQQYKFYTYRQNNSGGNFDHKPSQGISVFVIIQATDLRDADTRAQRAGLYFNGVDNDQDCSCCGDRWYGAAGYDQHDVPMVYSTEVWPGMPLSDPDVGKWVDGPEGYIHYVDGRIEPFWSELA